MSVAVVEHAVVSAPSPARTPGAARWASLGEFPPRPVAVSWPATGLGRAEVLELLGAAPFAVDNPDTQRRRLIAVGLLLDWLTGHPGTTWQQRWLTVEAEVAGLGWRQVLGRWRTEKGHTCSWHQDFLGVAMRMAISADLVRPSMSWLLSRAMGQGALVRVFATYRDPEGFARLQAHTLRNPM